MDRKGRGGKGKRRRGQEKGKRREEQHGLKRMMTQAVKVIHCIYIYSFCTH